MNTVERIELCLNVGGIDRPAEITIESASGKLTKPDPIKDSERLAIYKAAADQTFKLLKKALRSRDLTIRHGKIACLRAIAIGEHLLKCQKAFGSGDFTEWLDNYCCGNEDFSRATAFRYMRAVRYKNSLGPGVEFATLRELFIASGVFPEPEPSSGSSTKTAFFRLAFQVSEDLGDPSKWDRVVRQEFLEKAAPVVELYEKAKAAQGLN